ncbi:MAG: glycyl-radical enzyme activating protein [Acidobacteria bacterium]|nr:glycyl-radical enzyme activating protein [Acidobacteriota bacterium]
MRFSLRDGPGIRTTVFLKGCPLRCAWCHNPESQDFGPSLMFNAERCRHCGDCEAVCPHGLAACEVCGRCVEACVAEARQLAGRRVTVAELVAEIERDAIFFDESGGGVTLSGGEPMAQAEFSRAVLAACRARGIHTALDTCGQAPAETLLGVAAHADMVLFDLKAMDSDLHRRYTGVPNHAILANLTALAQAGHAVVVRYPLIPGVNDSAPELQAMADFLRPLGLRRLDLLPYHGIGIDKYRRLGIPCPLEEFSSPGPERVAQAAGALRSQGLDVRVGG